MDLKDLVEIIPGKTKVICYIRDKNMPGGWNSSMDNMVGKPYIVEHVNGEHVHLRYNEEHSFSFYYLNLELFNSASFILLDWQGRKLKCLRKIYSDSLRGCSLAEDFIAMKESVQTVNKCFESTPENLDIIQQKCPRIIGVLLSNNFIKRV
ncbi:hypothetical protein JZU46_04685 [bacterium]|nr:hypothetical protein [bacterium]